jgi:hypothetical protein
VSSDAAHGINIAKCTVASYIFISLPKWEPSMWYAQISEKCVHHIQVNMVLLLPVPLWVNVCNRKERIL